MDTTDFKSDITREELQEAIDKYPPGRFIQFYYGAFGRGNSKVKVILVISWFLLLSIAIIATATNNTLAAKIIGIIMVTILVPIVIGGFIAGKTNQQRNRRIMNELGIVDPDVYNTLRQKYGI